MKRCLILLIGLLFAASGLHALPAQAEERTPIRCSQGSGAANYVGQELVLVITEDGQLHKLVGEAWQALATPIGWADSILDLFSVAADGTIYLLDYDTHLIYRSEDRGATWQQTGQVPSTPDMIRDFAASPIHDMLFVGTFSQVESAISRSTDGGVIWEPVFPGGRAGIRFSPDFVRDGLVYAATWSKGYLSDVHQSQDWGRTWTYGWGSSSFSFGINGAVAFSPQFAQDGTAFTDQGGGYYMDAALYKTTDRGASWFKINTRVSRPPELSPDYLHDQTFIVGQEGRLMISQDGGYTLRPIFERAGASAGAVGMRLKGPTEPPSPPTTPGAYRYYLPIVGGSGSPLEFWAQIYDSVADYCYLYRSRDLGASWTAIVLP